MTRRAGAVVALVVALAAVAGPPAGASGAAAHQLHVDLTEWAVVPSQGFISSGMLRLTVANDGRLAHELDVIPTAWWGQPLFVRDGRATGEPAIRPVVVRPGETRSLHVYLPPGSYVLLDNLRGHYAAGGAVSIIAA